MKTADIFRLPYNTTVLIVICNHAYRVGASLAPKLGAGNVLGPLQILHIAVILQVIKFAPPVRAEHKQIHLVLNNITELLSLILFYDNLVGKTGAPHVLNSFQKTVAHIQLAALNVITLAGYAHDQIIAQCFGSF